MSIDKAAPPALGFYDPLTRRSVVGYDANANGSPIWLTWRGTTAVLIAGIQGAGKSHLHNALMLGIVRGRKAIGDVDVVHLTKDTPLEQARHALRVIVTGFGPTHDGTPSVAFVDEPPTWEETDEFWTLVKHLALRGRKRNATVVITTASPHKLPDWYMKVAEVALALPMGERDAQSFREPLRGHIVTEPSEFTSRRLSMYDQRSGVVLGSTLEPVAVHADCDCVARATALLAAHTAHVA